MADKQTEDRLKALEERNAHLMAMLETKLAEEAPAASGGINAAQLEAILTKVAETSAGPSQMLARQFKVEFDHLQMGPFEHPEGGVSHPKPELKREVVFGG